MMIACPAGGGNAISTDERRRPTLRVIRGDATDEEIAALLAVVAARAGASLAVDEEKRPVAAWADREALMRRAPAPGPGAWRASAWQR
jgi:hypothetical protein